MSGKRIVLCTFGSLGDLYPVLAIAVELTKRGHDAVVATSPFYRERVQAAGVAFHAVRPDVNCLDPAILKRVMHPTKGGIYLLTEIINPSLRDTYDDTVNVARNADLLVTHPVAVAAFAYTRKAGVRWASVALAPASMPSIYDMSVMPAIPAAEWLAARGPRTQRVLLRIFERMFEPHWKAFHDFERDIGAPVSRNPLLYGHSPHLSLALFSPMLAAPQRDWPAHSYATGFPFFESLQELSLPLQRFLDSGEPPIVFTLGSAAVGAAGDFFEQSIEAARRLRRRAVLLIGDAPENRTTKALPSDVIATAFAPHARLFPRACVNVHQGGIGTTGEAMRAGRPMLVVPYTHDQPDNAYRVKKLGIARSIPRSRYTADRAAREIDLILREPSYTQRAAEIGRAVRDENGSSLAADLLEQLLGVRSQRHPQTAAFSVGAHV